MATRKNTDPLAALIARNESMTRAIIPAGNYELKVDDYEVTTTSTGRDCVVVTFKLDENHFPIRHWVNSAYSDADIESNNLDRDKENTMAWHFTQTLKAVATGKVKATVVHAPSADGTQTYANIDRIEYPA